MVINKFYFLQKVSVRISIIFLLPFVALVVLILLVQIFDWHCSTIELSILIRFLLVYSGTAALFLAYIISSGRNRCCGSKRVKFGILLLLIFVYISIHYSINIDISCNKRMDDIDCEVNEINDPKNKETKTEGRYIKMLLLALYSNSDEETLVTYAYFEIYVIEKTNIIPICSSSIF